MNLLVLFAIALIARAIVGNAFSGPAYPDSYYYVHVADQLAAGNGFIVDYIWNFDDAGGRLLGRLPTLPVPANALWMPLAEIVQVPFLWLLGATPLAAGLPFWIIGALASPLAYLIGIDAGLGHTAALGAGLLVTVPAGLTPFVAQPDNFALFMTLGALSLWLCARGMRGDRRAFVIGGLVVGLATLARSDGVLLGMPFALVGLHDLWRRDRPYVGLTAAAGCALAFVLILAPWMYRQLDVFGSPMPSASSGRLLWLTDYQQLFSESAPPTATTFFDQGIAAILASRLGGLISALGLFVLMPLGLVLAPFAAIGAWRHRSDSAFIPFLVYAFALLAASALLFPVLVTHGTFIHSAAALVPHTFVLVTSGIGAVVAWVAARRSSWDVRRATAVFTYGAAGVAVAVALAQTVLTVGQWSAARSVQAALATSLGSASISERVMSASPGAFTYLAGHPGLVTPSDPLPVIEQVLRTYDVRWLVLERASIVPALEPILRGELSPAWLSRPVATVGPGTEPGSAPAGVIYAVCFTTTDDRCDG
jgi:4-amino-4-deoxy-L-arabinose transferase-like glycosyltransferase